MQILGKAMEGKFTEGKKKEGKWKLMQGRRRSVRKGYMQTDRQIDRRNQTPVKVTNSSTIDSGLSIRSMAQFKGQARSAQVSCS